MKTIRIVATHFGPLPACMPAFLASARRNPTVEWTILGDRVGAARTEGNLRFRPCSLDALAAHAASVLGSAVVLGDGYKVCDLRPAFGRVLARDLDGVDFWGHGDLDVVLGDLRRFLPDELLAVSDVVSARPEFLTGHLTLYRNRDRVNRLFESSADWRRILACREHHCFDECSRLWGPLLAGAHIEALESDIDSMTHVVTRLAERAEVRWARRRLVRSTLDLAPGWEVRWEDGRLSVARTGEEFAYFHLGPLKDREGFRAPRWSGSPARFRLDETGFDA